MGARIIVALFVLGGMARADVTLLVEEPYGNFGGMNPTGHSAVYFSRICAASPTELRMCEPGEQGAVISRYHRVAGRDWLAIPLVPYLYAVDREEAVPASVTPEEAEKLRDQYRRQHLEELIPDAPGGGMPEGDWTQLVGEAYLRTMYGFTIHTTVQQDEKLIRRLNSRKNQVQFHLLFNNCADFVRNLVDFYYPHAVHRSFTSDLGIMTPNQAAKSLLRYARKHPQMELKSFVVEQVPGTVARSGPVRGVLESLIKSKRYAVPVLALAVLHPLVGGPLVIAALHGSGFDPRKAAQKDEIGGHAARATVTGIATEGR